MIEPSTNAPQTAIFQLQDLTFYYPEQREKALDGLTLSVHAGEFLVLCGPSGCGKSTLLRQLKTVLAPHGHRLGDVLFDGTPLDALPQEVQSQKIGFVMQSPENQIVTDKVWHELAFGLESLGCDTPTIRRRVAEMASFFGIETWFYKDVGELSGGQKQLLNLASVMAMNPSVLILDEPTSQLDPIAASDFLAILGKINRELGTTILLTEHRLEEAFPLASRVAVMDRGALLCTGTPNEVGQFLKDAGHDMFLAMPTAMRVWAATKNDAPCPVTVRDGREWLGTFARDHALHDLPTQQTPGHPETPVITARDLWYRYERDLPDVVRGLNLTVKKGELLAILGGNGTGKTTSLNLIGGLLAPDRGELTVSGRLSLLPQNPQTLFAKKTVREDLFELLQGEPLARDRQEAKVARVVALCRLEALLDRHPYDLSGGEQQRAALAKVLLLDPEILLLDEPTKGLDAAFKVVLAEILRTLLQRGVTIVMVSHDIEFCAQYAHRCGLFFDGSIVTEGAPRAFFPGNSFYTTSANRMARDLMPHVVTPEDLITVCGGELPCAPTLPAGDVPLPAPEEGSPSAPLRKLPRWRTLLAVMAAVVAAVCFAISMGVTDLSALITAQGATPQAQGHLMIDLLLVAALFVFALAVYRKAPPPVCPVQVPAEKRTLSKRTIAAAVMILLLIPVTLFVGVYYLGDRKYFFISLLVLLESMLPFFLVFEGRKPQARELVMIAVLCAMGVAGRAAFFMLPSFKPVMAIAIISGVALGAETGFLVGSTTMLVSNVMFSQGTWTPWQMFSMGIIGFLAGVFFRKGLMRRTRASLCVFGGLATILIFGGIMNFSSAVASVNQLTWPMLLTYYISGFPMDLVHACSTVLFLWFGGEPLLETLDRIKVKYGLVDG